MIELIKIYELTHVLLKGGSSIESQLFMLILPANKQGNKY